MSSLSSNNSNADMEVINAEDLEDSPPPGEAEDVTAVDEMKDAQETKEEEVVVEATASGDTEQIGEIVDVDEEIVNKSASEEVAEVEDDDDPPIEILEAPTPPLAEDSVLEPALEVVPAVEVAPVVAAAVPADPTPAAAIVETPAAVIKDADYDPPIEILEASTPPLAEESEPEVEVAPAAVEVASVLAAAPIAVAAESTPAVAKVETPASAAAPAPSAPSAATAPAAPVPQPQVVSVRPTVTAERPAATLEEVDDEEEDDDDIDETLAERLVGLTEMFPDFVRTGSVSLVKSSWSLTQSCYSLGRAASWVIFSSATLLFMPIMIESERLQMQDQMKAQKNQILLGPGAAVSGGPSLGPPPI